MGSPGRVLALDLGTRRIGLAISDSEARIAFPAGTLVRRDLQRDLEALRGWVEEREVVRIVVGLPLHLSGRAGAGARAAREFAERLAEATGRPVDLLDERWSTREAERALRDVGASRRRRRESVDETAAAILLRAYLERPQDPRP